MPIVKFLILLVSLSLEMVSLAESNDSSSYTLNGQFNHSPTIEKSDFQRASKHGHIGETGTLHQSPNGYFFHPFYNDFFGGTDKHLTNMFLLGGLWSSNQSSLELTLNWRFITPDTRAQFAADDLNSRDGVFSDWISIDGAWRKDVFIGEGTWFTQLDFGIGKIGNHGAKDLQTSFHKALKNNYQNLYYDAPFNGSTVSAGWQWGKRFKADFLEYQWLTGAHQNFFIQEIYTQVTAHLNIGQASQLAIDGRIIRQTESQVYSKYGLRSFRREIAFGLRGDENWSPSLKFVSPFVERDKGWQVYLDLLSWDMAKKQ